MSEQQIKEYLQKYNITSKELLASHIEELKRNTIPNTKLISELVWVLEDFFFSFFERSSYPAEKDNFEKLLENPNSTNDIYRELKKCSNQCFCDGSCKKPQKYNFGLTEQLNTVVGNLGGINKPPQKTINSHFLDEITEQLEKQEEKPLKNYEQIVTTTITVKTNPEQAEKIKEIVKEFNSQNSAEKNKTEENLVFPKDSEIHKEGIKESNGKIDYSEIDWDIVDLMAKRFNNNKHKYPQGNMLKPIEEKELLFAGYRHLRKMLQPIDNDSESFLEHLIAVMCNMQMLYQQKKLKNSDKIKN